MLIQEYENQRVLWAPKDVFHFSKLKKNDAWPSIAHNFNNDIEECKKKCQVYWVRSAEKKPELNRATAQEKPKGKFNKLIFILNSV